MKYKIVFFDCDGVLSSGNTWVELHKSVGIPEGKNFHWRSQFYNKKITWEQWFDNFEPYYRKSKYAKKDFEKILNKISLNPEAKQLFSKLKKIEVKTVIVSGSVDHQVERIAKYLDADLWRANTIIRYNNKGHFQKFLNTSDEVRAKEIFIKEICSKFKVKPAETFFVGDSINDSAAFKLTQHGILYNNLGRQEDLELEKYAWKKIDHLLEILDFIE